VPVNEVAVDHPPGVDAARVPDVRSVPLAQLLEDAAAQRAVASVTEKMADPAGVRVATFNSAI
jgi:FXSXX-COOH protein